MYQLPAQMAFAVGQNYAFPGIYQYAVQQYPDAPVPVRERRRLAGLQIHAWRLNRKKRWSPLRVRRRAPDYAVAIAAIGTPQYFCQSPYSPI